MEILQILHHSLPQKNKICTIFAKKKSEDISRFLLKTIKSIKKSTKDIRTLNLFFMEIYDMLYHYVIFDQIKVAKKMMRLLGELAVPIKYAGEEERKNLLKKIVKIKI